MDTHSGEHDEQAAEPLATMSRGSRIVEQRVARATVLLAAVATGGSLAGAVNADRVDSDTWGAVTLVLIAAATAAAMVAVRRSTRVRPRTAPSMAAFVLTAAWLVVVGIAALTLDALDEWRWTALVAALTVPNWVTVARALRTSHGS